MTELLDPKWRKREVKDLRRHMQLVCDMVQARLDAGHHPHDVAMSAWDMTETWARIHIDGSFPEGR